MCGVECRGYLGYRPLAQPQATFFDPLRGPGIGQFLRQAQGLRPFGGPFRRAQDPEFVSGLRACGPSTGSGPAAAAEAHLSAGGLGPCDGELKNSCFVAVRAHLTNWACGGYKIRKCLQVANRTTHPRANPPRSGGRPGRSSKGLSKAGRRPRQCGAKLLRPSGRVFPCTSSFP